MKKGIWTVILILAVIVFAGSAGYLGYRFYHSQEQEAQKKELDDQVKIDIDELLNLEFNGERDGITSPIPEDVFTDDTDKRIDFDKLQAYNKELVAWIYIPNTKIDYPIARHKDEDQTYYLNYDMYGEPSYSGCIYMEKANKKDFTDNNTVIYGHNMKNGTMFSSLTKYKSQSYYDEHPVLYFYTPNGDYKIELIAGFVSKPTGEVYNTNQTYEQVLEYCSHSTFCSNVVPNNEDSYITLSTCSYEFENARYVVVGILK